MSMDNDQYIATCFKAEHPEAYNAIIEECARVAENVAVVTDYGREKIAAAIRALKDKP